MRVKDSDARAAIQQRKPETPAKERKPKVIQVTLKNRMPSAQIRPFAAQNVLNILNHFSSVRITELPNAIDVARH